MREFIESLAKKAGEVLLDNFQRDPELLRMRSSAKEAATKYDKIVDELIVNEIRQKYPTHSILAEESGFLKGDSDWLWIIDSLDGTGNFANQNPLFCVCIGLMWKDELKLGVIYAPAINEFYLAEQGKGAFLNQKRIFVSELNELSKSYIFYCEGGERNRLRTGKILNTIYPHVTDIRKLGSAGLEIAWVASGRAEAYFTTKIEPWDVAAGVLILKEAGGEVSDFKGQKWQPKKSDLLFSNAKIHEKVLNLIKHF